MSCDTRPRRTAESRLRARADTADARLPSGVDTTLVRRSGRDDTVDTLKVDPVWYLYVSRRVRDRLGPVRVVVLVALVLVVVTGTWPPLVAVESSSMSPAVERGDLVVVTAADRFPWNEPVGSDSIEDTRSAPPERFGRAGDVVVFAAPVGRDRPILHRVAFHVSAGEDWTKRGDPAMVEETCDDLGTCPAPYDGYVTYGDANGRYDQSVGIAPVVREDRIHAKALVAIPAVGHLRLAVDAAVERHGLIPAMALVAVVVSIASGVLALAVGRLRDGWQRRGTRREDG